MGRANRSAVILSNYASSRWVVKELLVTELGDICISTLGSVQDLDFHVLCDLGVVYYSIRESGNTHKIQFLNIRNPTYESTEAMLVWGEGLINSLLVGFLATWLL
jgi:hypothetical protein